MNEQLSGSENVPVVEQQEKRESRIVLHFLRHGAKEQAQEGQSDETVQLTPEGRRQAADKSTLEDVSQSIAFGSPRERAQQTAALAMTGKQEDITGEETLEELRRKFNPDRFSEVDPSVKLNVGSKIGVDPRLNFTTNKKTEFGQMTDKAVKDGTLLKLIVEESDEWAKEPGNEGNIFYSENAAKVASIIEKYIGISPRWDQLVQQEPKYKETLERFMGTHQTVGESFLAKIIELTKGVEERGRFVAALDNSGFGFTEGFDIEINKTGDGEPEIRVIFKKERDGKTIYELNEIIPSDTLEEIIRQGQELIK